MRLRLILSFVLVVLIAVVGVVTIARQGAASEVRAFMQRGGMVRLESISAALESYYQQNSSWDGVAALLDELWVSPVGGSGMGNRPDHAGQGQGMMAGVMSGDLLLADSTGVIVADTAEARLSDHLSNTERQLALPLKSGLSTVGYLLPAGGATFTTGDERFLLERLTRAAIIGGLIAGGVSLLLALYLAYRLIQPVRSLTVASQRLSDGDLSQRVTINGQDELAELGRTFNQMAESLQRSRESRRAMTADIAHELRTPLAVQRANLEALQDGIYPLTPGNLEPVIEQNRLLNRLVEDLGLLALADAGQLKLEAAATDLRTLVMRVVERFRPQADSHQVTLSLHSQPDLPTVYLDPMRFDQVLGNLLSNALRYTAAGGAIYININEEPSHVNVTVRDTGPGISEEALPHVFERFYRADRSRSRGEGGSGLGLAIARQIVEAHGGVMSVANHPQGGAEFTIRLPASYARTNAHD